MRPEASPVASRQLGFSMLEVLVSMVVLSTGLLGVANLQVTAMRGNQGAYLSSVAAQQAQDMAERLNANPAGVAANQYDAVDTSIPTVAVDCQSASCSPAQLALYDRNRWNTANQASLPGGAGQVHVSATDNSLYLIGVRWHDKSLAGANGWQAGTDFATACGTPQADTRCFVLRHEA
jgi:type IV pilus assembly protein PilV